MSQSILPDNFSTDGLSAIERRRLEYYYEHFVLRRSYLYGEGHFILACYAALPVVLTPDLLYKLWLNFKNYWWKGKCAVIHPVAPADLLLSPLVEEIGYELYEMPEKIRELLLLHLEKITAQSNSNPLQLYSLTEISRFLHSYAQLDFTPANANDDAFREAQIWTALSYLDPGQAFGELVKKFQKANNKAEQLRYSNALDKMSGRFLLEVVHDPALIPTAHKAVTALTSVIKDVFNDRQPEKLAELQWQLEGANVKLTDEPSSNENVINIEIDESVTARLGSKAQPRGKRTLRALVVGVTRMHAPANQKNINDKESAELLAELLHDEDVIGEREIDIVVLTGDKATKQAILSAWLQVVESTGEADDLLLYLAADATADKEHCCIICADTENKNSLLLDEEIGSVVSNKRVASITMIIQTDHAATKYWLDTSKDGYVVFAACRYDQRPIYFHANTENGRSVCTFTYALERSLREHRLKVTNRVVFIQALYYYDEVLETNVNWRARRSPVLLCNENSYNLFFTQGNNSRVKLQAMLRDTGYYNKEITGKWDEDTAVAFRRYMRTAGLLNNPSKQGYIKMLVAQKKARLNDKPVFLFIFCDPERNLIEIKREQTYITDLLSASELADQVELQVLQDPDRKTFREYLVDPENRGRIQLVYYSGFDMNGDFLLKDGPFTLTDFTSLLDYQQNIQLLVSNTCRSEYFAEYVAMLGVPQAIGVKDEITDMEGAELGMQLVKTIISGGRLEEIPELAQPYTSRKSGFVLHKKYPMEVLPWNFKMTPQTEKVATVFVARNGFPSFNNKIIGREGLFQQIEQRLSAHRPLLLSGVGGMGKTTAAIGYCKSEKYASKYKYVIWADARDGIFYGIGRAFDTLSDMESRRPNELDNKGVIGFEIGQLKSLPGNNLLVIDNANDPQNLHDFIYQWVENKVESNCLVITRCNLDGEDSIKITPLALAEAIDVFRNISHSLYAEKYFSALYDHIEKNMLIWEVLAGLSKSMKPASEFGKILPSLKTEGIAFLHNYPQFEGYKKIMGSYEPATLDAGERDLLIPLSLFPTKEFLRQLFITVLGPQQESIIEALIQKGWLEGTEQVCQIPFIVKEMCRNELRPDMENCSPLVARLNAVINDMPGEHRHDLLTIAASVVKEIGFSGYQSNWSEYEKLRLVLAKLLLNDERYNEGLEVITRTDFLSAEHRSADEQMEALLITADLYDKKGEPDKSLEYLYECSDLLTEESDDPINHGLQSIAVTRRIAALNHEMKRLEFAVNEYKKAVEIAKELHERNEGNDEVKKVLAECYMDLGGVTRDMDDHVNALDYFKRSLFFFSTVSLMDGVHANINTLNELIRQSQEVVDKQQVRREKNELPGFQLEEPVGNYFDANVERRTSVKEGTEEAFIVDRTLVFLTGDVTEQQRHDVLNSLLLAQLTARKQFPEIEQTVEWHRSFMGVLGQLGHIVEKTAFNQFNSRQHVFELKEAVMDIWATEYGGNSFTLIRKSLDAIQHLDKKRSVARAFEKNTHAENHAAFQICIVTNQHDVVILNTGMFLLESHSQIKEILSTRFSRENVLFRYAAYSSTLNEEVYAHIRNAVNDKLRSVSGNYITSIDID